MHIWQWVLACCSVECLAINVAVVVVQDYKIGSQKYVTVLNQ